MARSEARALHCLAEWLCLDVGELEPILPPPVNRVYFNDDNYGDGVHFDEDGNERFTCGDQGAVAIVVSPGHVVVAETTIDRLSHFPRYGPGRVHLEGPIPPDPTALGAAVAAAAEARIATYQTCVDCGWVGPHEHMSSMDGDVACHGCATEHHGVIF